MSRTIYFTVFDQNYAARGLVMLDSLRRNTTGSIETVLLALDDAAARVSKGHVDRILRVEDLQDDEFLASKQTRPHEEFCWSCAPVLSNFIVQSAPHGSMAVYLDADLFFTSDPQLLLAEMGTDKNMMIHEHRFSSARIGWERSSGRFNVGFVAFRVSDEALRCAERWRRQVLDLCVKDPERGLCGDQGYLNEWPEMYKGLHVMQNIGGGVAPWNVEDYSVTSSLGVPSVNGTPIVFCHFHQLRIVDQGRHQFIGAICAAGYDFPASVQDILYKPYLRQLYSRAMTLQREGIPLQSNLNYDMETLKGYLKSRHVVLCDTLKNRLLVACDVKTPVIKGLRRVRQLAGRVVPAELRAKFASIWRE